LSADVVKIIVNKTSFEVEKLHGFVCLLIFQSGYNPGFFFLAAFDRLLKFNLRESVKSADRSSVFAFLPLIGYADACNNV